MAAQGVMKAIRLQKGFDLNIDGKPSNEVEKILPGSHLGVLPNRIPFVKPRLLVKEGDPVNIGSVLYEDKRNTDVKFLSPGGGIIEQIKFGRRRVIQEIVIALGSNESCEDFEKFSSKDMDRIDRHHLVRAIMAGGLWSLFRAFPFGDMPEPDQIPPAIIVNMDSKEPFHPLAEVYLRNNIVLFHFGLELLKRFTEKVYLTTTMASPLIMEGLNGRVTHQFLGPYPAGDPGVSLYYIKKRPEENRSWAIYGQDLLLLASLIKNGQYPTERMMTIGGSMAGQPKHLLARMGVQLRNLTPQTVDEQKDVRYIAGGVFRGYASQADSFMGLRETSLVVMSKGDKKEFLGFARPGYNKSSYSKTFLSRFRASPFDVDCGFHGEKRACINCGYCAEVCAVDILPQFTLKTVLAGELEEALAHGLLDCVSCGLCTYVCPSKIDICDILKKAIAEYYNEIH
jgi:Na+-transporting NADH:ubiquinone oxidoreductase subunit A